MTKETENRKWMSSSHGVMVAAELNLNCLAIFLRHNQTKIYPSENGLQSKVVWIAKQLLFSLALVDVG